MRAAVSGEARRRGVAPAAPRRVHRGAIAAAALLLGVAVLSASTAAAAQPGPTLGAGAGRHGGVADARWQRYVEGPADSNVTPVSIVSTSGDVRNGAALLRRGHGAATLTRSGTDTGSSDILLDYGEDVGGLPYFAVTGETGSPTLHVSYSEGGQYADQPNGDTNPTTGIPRPGEDPHRYDDYSVAAAGTISASLIQGGERYERISLTSPGTVTLRAAGIRFMAYDATPEKYQGWFESSDDVLNRIWYAGAYTTQLNMIPAHTPDGGPQPVIFDGAKRDRLVWVGDIAQDVPTIADSLGSNGADYVKGSLAIFGANPPGSIFGAPPAPPGEIGGLAFPTGTVYQYSNSYSMYFVSDIASYFEHSGDLAFARREWPAIQGELAFNAANVDPSSGLFITNPPSPGGLDWDLYDGPKTGGVTEFNALYYHDLLAGADMARALGDDDQADAYASQAAALRHAINTTLYDTPTGVYDISTEKRGSIAEDANVAAVLYGVASPARAEEVLSKLKQLWISTGSEPFSSDTGYSTLVSPFINGFDVQARFASADTTSAYALLRRVWGQMVTPGNQYTGAFWENYTPSGMVSDGSISLAHGWSSAPTSALSEYVLGIRPLTSGFATWTVAPQPGNLHWAAGQIPTPYGPIAVRWRRSGRHFDLSVSAPAGTSGTIVVPAGSDATVRVDGHPVWSGSHATGSHIAQPVRCGNRPPQRAKPAAPCLVVHQAKERLSRVPPGRNARALIQGSGGY
jgi:Bacterial alpha-L-rhamnosidase C-terminal domain/Bacterial alpha-L-rhamnosidase 6 hairpin glycosidase domain